MVDNDGLHSLTNPVQFGQWTEIEEFDVSTARGLVGCAAWDELWHTFCAPR